MIERKRLTRLDDDAVLRSRGRADILHALGTGTGIERLPGRDQLGDAQIGRFRIVVKIGALFVDGQRHLLIAARQRLSHARQRGGDVERAADLARLDHFQLARFVVENKARVLGRPIDLLREIGQAGAAALPR